LAGVIKRDQFASRQAFSFQNLEAHAADIVRRAEIAAVQLRETARQAVAAELEQLRTEARAAGEAAGRQAGYEQVTREARSEVRAALQKHLTSVIGALTAAVRDFDRAKRHLLAEAETGLIELSLAIARRICKWLPETTPAVAEANARHVLALVGPQADLELHVHPDEAAAVSDWAAELAGACDELPHVRIVADPAVTRGGCVLRGREVVVDAALDTQLDRIARALIGAGDEPAAPPLGHESGPAGGGAP
jgi:flagellar assembly protein FliH